MTFDEYLGEAIKNWKHAHNDLAKERAAGRSAGHEWHTHSLTKAGKESGMHDARKSHESEDAAHAHIKQMQKNNPNSNLKYNLYHKTKHVGTH